MRWYYISRRSSCPLTVSHQSSNELMATRPEVKPTILYR